MLNNLAEHVDPVPGKEKIYPPGTLFYASPDEYQAFLILGIGESCRIGRNEYSTYTVFEVKSGRSVLSWISTWSFHERVCSGKIVIASPDVEV